jgi:hypothetical protein
MVSSKRMGRTHFPAQAKTGLEWATRQQNHAVTEPTMKSAK